MNSNAGPARDAEPPRLIGGILSRYLAELAQRCLASGSISPEAYCQLRAQFGADKRPTVHVGGTAVP